MKNIHSDFFDGSKKTEKRKNQIPHMISKKIKHDGREKRKLDEGEENIIKKIKKEFKCLFCERFFKSIFSLKKHEKIVHSSTEKGIKRQLGYQYHPDVYTKRQKGETKKVVEYVNYF